ncbi:phosphohistidine phosphatase SixA [Halomonas dongshanensis]|uniref:Phosphohistidine phosphatase SixA n=1 Tax=Halomonas dongshanensis TaxID=2890835 RepID=A0ABT2EEH3_9GAMM|nr:phosphohistidine phosphatase SixA [Halomonas dongshanensis]MCS2609981.1 phosphohistidine phosphatase SixA [Halomonas dongshanensis]
MAKLLIMRHGEANPGYPDAARTLSAAGEGEVHKMAQWLRGHIEHPVRLWASPYRRAQQTAGFLAEALGVSVETLSHITPDDAPEGVIDWLLEEPSMQAEGYVILVSHMPLVGELTARLVEDASGRTLGFPTVAIAELDAEVWAAGCAQLKSFTEPSQL